ncbi:hypothetical protein E2C01_028057 [Portunus trituberculatus]|uniref:Uncharacterized protein n=1 Tax=Portunus trituberculatus TaxID=210409 RepID=A0A5B7ENB2_PORTR|nr:hypothetical protein [Portunus trituberculatus]
MDLATHLLSKDLRLKYQKYINRQWYSGTMRVLGSEGSPSAQVRILSTVRVRRHHHRHLTVLRVCCRFGHSGQDMFSARLIRKKVEKTSSSQVTRDKKTTKRKRKNGKVHAKPLATRKKRLRVASDGASTAVTTTTITTGHQNTATDTDINKNKVRLG